MCNIFLHAVKNNVYIRKWLGNPCIFASQWNFISSTRFSTHNKALSKSVQLVMCWKSCERTEKCLWSKYNIWHLLENISRKQCNILLTLEVDSKNPENYMFLLEKNAKAIPSLSVCLVTSKVWPLVLVSVRNKHVCLFRWQLFIYGLHGFYVMAHLNGTFRTILVLFCCESATYAIISC